MLPHVALIVIDMLNDFVKGSLKTDSVKKIIPNVKDLIGMVRTKKFPSYIATMSTHPV